eukprot:1251962-Pyramimonas_sp.AAC.1
MFFNAARARPVTRAAAPPLRALHCLAVQNRQRPPRARRRCFLTRRASKPRIGRGCLAGGGFARSRARAFHSVRSGSAAPAAALSPRALR